MLRGTGTTSSSIPRRGCGRRRAQRAAERAGRAREYEALDARGDRGLEQRQRPDHVRVDEIAAPMRADVRLVQRRGVHDRVHAVDAAPHERGVGDRADDRGVRRREHVEPDGVRQDAHERLAEMPRAAG
jgi:hypothetical protein